MAYKNDKEYIENGFSLKKMLNLTFNFTVKSVLLIGVIIIAVIMGKTCFYIVSPSEEAVIKRFGKVIDVTAPGPHFKLPNPIETVNKAKVTEIHQMEIGYRSQSGIEKVVENESLMLTGDENIISIDLVVQYQIKDIVEYLFILQDVEMTIQLAAEATIREVAGKANIDDILTTGKEQVQEDTKQLLQEILDNYRAGVRIVAVELQDIEPPAPVMGAFQDVASAREDKNKFINEAQAYENQKIPMARAQAATVLLEAESYKATVLGRAEGEAERFMQVYESYRKAPDVTRKRMYLEAVTSIIANSEVIVVDDSVKNLNLFSGMERLIPAAGAGK
ncbi:MAG: FtsH protease activity modulator HflK [Deferribacteraceae bacterium]|jgi:membrane protease subunit HflK|nr:FtsH protease activity modulator HflK [Deferribacteraceae bacterium]